MRPPGLTGLDALRGLHEYLRDPLPRWAEWRRRFGDLVRWEVPGVRATLVFHPEHLEQVLVRRQENYPREGPGYDLLRTVQGRGLATAEGGHWRRQRRMAQPLFHQSRVRSFAPAMTRAAEDLASRWREDPPGDRPVDVGRAMLRLAIRIGAEALASADLTPHLATLEEALDTVLEELGGRISRPLSWPLWLPLPAHLRFREAVASIDAVTDALIRKRRGGPPGPPDLLTALMEVRDEAGDSRGMSDRELRDEVVTLAGAGHETTSLALTWTFHQLSLHPGVRERLEAELDAVLGGRPPGPDDLERLPWLRAVVAETLRLFPPVHGATRAVREEDTLGGATLPAGSLVVLSPWVTHRHPAFWDAPEAFDPERFLGPGPPSAHRLAYLPFGAGPHRCIGEAFALLDLHLVVASLAQRVRLDLVEGGAVPPMPRLTLRPARPVLMRVRPRAW